VPGSFVFFVVLLAWGADGLATKDSGVKSDWTLTDCHARSQKFSLKHDTVLQQCARISKKGYNIIAAQEVTFNFRPGELEMIEDDVDTRVAQLTAALKAIGRLHVGKTRDSQKVRAIIRKVMK
jgi:hypothetical protein